MQKWANVADMRKIGVLLFDGFSNHCLANTVEPLRAANMLSRQDLYTWHFLAPEGGVVTSSSGLPVAAHQPLEAASGDMLVVMPSYGFRDLGDLRGQTALRRAARRFDVVAGLDTGSWLMAEAGLLTGRKATIHWEELDSFAERFPEVEVLRERFVIDGNRVTCSGAMAAFDLVMFLIGQENGQALALEVAQLFMVRGSARSHAGGIGVMDRVVNRALAVMDANLEDPLPLSQVASRAGCSQKTLETRMRAGLGATPKHVYRRMRLNLARKLVTETDLSVAEIAVRTGYVNASAMTRAFREEFGTPPRQMRQTDQSA
ncbi:GlxA family transcriptional regulator [Shimia biformata]|uniref:GlxA family transcriptional regulator n=1 Tax=Shimia biformata TaxID=1294299 RepID=UPI00194F8946|nr:GlxA family transcriptional regulator [Shimia biformata]